MPSTLNASERAHRESASRRARAQPPSARVTADTSSARPARTWFNAGAVFAHGNPAACMRIAARVSFGFCNFSVSAASVHRLAEFAMDAHSAASVAHAGTPETSAASSFDSFDD